MQKQIKNVARYLATAQKQTALALHSYKQANTANYKYASYANATAQHYIAKHAHIANNAQHFTALILAQCLHNSNTYANAVADLQYITNAYKVMQA